MNKGSSPIKFIGGPRDGEESAIEDDKLTSGNPIWVTTDDGSHGAPEDGPHTVGVMYRYDFFGYSQGHYLYEYIGWSEPK